jgi:hypothetical protein
MTHLALWFHRLVPYIFIAMLVGFVMRRAGCSPIEIAVGVTMALSVAARIPFDDPPK